MTNVVVVYESVYGNTHLIAEAIGRGFRARQGPQADVSLKVSCFPAMPDFGRARVISPPRSPEETSV